MTQHKIRPYFRIVLEAATRFPEGAYAVLTVPGENSGVLEILTSDEWSGYRFFIGEMEILEIDVEVVSATEAYLASQGLPYGYEEWSVSAWKRDMPNRLFNPSDLKFGHHLFQKLRIEDISAVDSFVMQVNFDGYEELLEEGEK